MNLKILLFASAKDALGGSELTINLPTGATVADLKQALANEHPDAQAMLETCVISVQQQYVTEDMVLNPTQEIALIPPVSGG